MEIHLFYSEGDSQEGFINVAQRITEIKGTRILSGEIHFTTADD